VKDSYDISVWMAAELVGLLGAVIALPLVGGLLGGLYLDRFLGTGGLFLVLGILLGLALGGAGAYFALMKVLKWKP
jgi:F0F1-type ATP synthase assembly protein I